VKPDHVDEAVRDALAFAQRNPQDTWFALEILLISDAWSALPEFFKQTGDALLEADYAHEFFLPELLAKVRRKAWDATDNPTLRGRMLSWSRGLTGEDPTDNLSEIRVARQFSENRNASGGEDAEPDWKAVHGNLTNQLSQNPGSANNQLLLGWVESKLGNAEAASAWRRRAGWHILLGADFEPSRLNEVIFRHDQEEYWQAAVDMIHHLRPNDVDFLPFLERQFSLVNQGKADLAETIGWMELGRLRFLSPAKSYMGLQGYLYHARRLAELRMRLALKNGNAELARKIREDSLDLLLKESAEVRERLIGAGHPEFAREYIVASLDRMLSRLKDYPKAVEGRNNAGWSAALSRERIPEALALMEETQKAVKDLPVNARDTLAELLFQSERDAEAIALAEQNARENPEDAYLARQVERMGKKDRSSIPR
jgi:hypothetical protein